MHLKDNNKMNSLKRFSSTKINKAVSKDNEDHSTIGFSIDKIFDKNSIFCGLPSLNTIASYVELFIENWHLIPTSKDSPMIFKAKAFALLWRSVRSINLHKGKVMQRPGFHDVDFGGSEEIIFEMFQKVFEPDEVFRPSTHTPFNPPYDMYRYKIENGYIYWILEKSKNVNKVVISDDLSKDDVLKILWERLGRVIQLESNDCSLCYIKSELTQKKIFGSSNSLIDKLKEDYRYFRENKLSRGYLLIGKPGTGKTGIVNSIVESVDGRVFIISGFDSIASIEEMESLFTHMRPDFIIFDDCDRSNASPTFIKVVLKMLESVKDKNPHTNFLFTANTFSGILMDEAVTRKGRIDQIYEVPEPCESDRKEIFQRYTEEMCIELSNEDLIKCVEASGGMTGADIKELCIQLQRASIDEVFEQANEISLLRKKYSDSTDLGIRPVYTKM